MIGEVREAAVWCTPHLIWRGRSDIQRAFRDDRKIGYEFEPIRWAVLKPGEDGAPLYTAESGAVLVVGRAKVTTEPAHGTFLAELDRVDLKRLRKLTREAHRAQCPWARPMRDTEVDDVIEEFGPKAAEGALRELVARGH